MLHAACSHQCCQKSQSDSNIALTAAAESIWHGCSMNGDVVSKWESDTMLLGMQSQSGDTGDGTRRIWRQRWQKHGPLAPYTNQTSIRMHGPFDCMLLLTQGYLHAYSYSQDFDTQVIIWSQLFTTSTRTTVRVLVQHLRGFFNYLPWIGFPFLIYDYNGSEFNNWWHLKVIFQTEAPPCEYDIPFNLSWE